jgi:hypothetical protein
MKKIFTILMLLGICFFAPFSELAAQAPYKASIGLRAGLYRNFGLDAKVFLNEESAIHLAATTRKYDIFWFTYNYNEFTAVYEQQQQLAIIDELKGLYWYAGGGLSLGNFSGDVTGNLFGLTGSIGLEYVFNKVPITISFDWQPRYFINSNLYEGGFAGNSGGLKVAYCFGKKVSE